MANLKTSENGERKPQVIVAIPCFNEERFIGSVVLKTKRYVDKVLVIDDGSSDGSAEVARDAGATVYRHESNKGYGAAVRTALQKGREQKADILVIIDGDGQHDPREIPRLVKPILDGQADVVVGSRFLGEAQKVPFYRRLGQRALTAITNVGSGHKLSDSQSGFRAYSSEALKVLNLSESGMSVSSEIQFAISKSGLKVAEVPITVSYMDKAKRNPMGHGMSVLSRLLVLISLRQPLVLFGVPGIMLLSGGLALGVRVLDIYSKTSQVATGSAFGAVLLLVIGILALFAALMLQSMKELLRREWEQLEKREIPLYGNQEGEADSESK
jgi:glycosyltransferase involved in cell wall biosynthesis